MKNLKTPLGIIGLLYIIFGLVMNVWMFIGEWWPTYLYFISIGIGVLFLLISGLTKRLPRFKIWQLTIGITPILVFYLFIQINKSSEDIFIIQENFKGQIVVIYGQPDGAKKEFEKDKRLYRIPKDGILKTQFKLKGDVASFGEYYYQNDQNKRIKLETFPYYESFPDSTKIYVHNWQLGNTVDSDGNKFTYQQATIGSKTDTFETDVFKILEKSSQPTINKESIKSKDLKGILITESKIGNINLDDLNGNNIEKNLKLGFPAFQIKKEIGQQDGPDFILYQVDYMNEEIFFVSMDTYDTTIVQDVWTRNPKVKDEYDATVGLIIDSVLSKRPDLKFHSDLHYNIYATKGNSKIEYRLNGDFKNFNDTSFLANEYTVEKWQVEGMKIEYIIWKK